MIRPILTLLLTIFLFANAPTSTYAKSLGESERISFSAISQTRDFRWGKAVDANYLCSTHPILLDSSVRLSEPNVGEELKKKQNSYKNRALKHDRWLGRDKLLHFSYSLVFTVGIKTVNDNLLGFEKDAATVSGAGITLFIGYGKELLDDRHPRNIFSAKDFVADVLGVAAGILLLQLF